MDKEIQEIQDAMSKYNYTKAVKLVCAVLKELNTKIDQHISESITYPEKEE